MTATLRVALLGAGKMATQHAAAIRVCHDAQLVAVVDPSVATDDIAARFGADVAAFTDTAEMLASIRPDVVHVVTPPATHAALARQCLAAGAHIYVEKPFALNVAEAQAVLKVAETRGLKVCAGHQVFFQESGPGWHRFLPLIGEIVHAESFFSFRPVRRRAGGGGLADPVDQLIDILPHPVYLLLNALGCAPPDRVEVSAFDVVPSGEIRAVLRCGNTLGVLVVSLQARPVESWLRVMGKNGMVEADFVLGNVIVHPGPGASAPSVILKPFSRAWQVGWGSLKAVVKLLFLRDRSYPGLAELIRAFYSSIREGNPSPISATEILDTVRVCEVIGARLRTDAEAAAALAFNALNERARNLPDAGNRGTVLVTGGTGMLGRPTSEGLRRSGWRVRVPVRRDLSPTQRLPGLEYVRADLGASVPDRLMDGVDIVLHLAAETGGTQPDHERNTVRATRNLLDAMKRTGIRRLVNVSSVAVLKPSRFRRPLREDSPVDAGNLRRGPYVWAKAAAERLAQAEADTGAIELRTVRLGPLVDFDTYAPPGRLGREVARLFVAMGMPYNRLAVCGVGTAAAALQYCAEQFDSAPSLVNLLEVPAVPRRALVSRLRSDRPDLRIVWLPFPLLAVLNLLATALQKVFRPSKPALNLYAAFKSEAYDVTVAKQLIAASHQRSRHRP